MALDPVWRHHALHFRCVSVCGVMSLILGVIMWAWNNDQCFQAALLIISGIMSFVYGIIGCMAASTNKQTDKSKPAVIVQLSSQLMDGCCVVIAGIPLICVTAVTCVFSIFYFGSSTVSIEKTPTSFTMLLSAIAISFLEYLGSIAFFVAAIDLQKMIATSLPNYQKVDVSDKTDITS